MELGITIISFKPRNPWINKQVPLSKNKKPTKVVCWEKGNSLREFLYVDDLAEAIIFILNKWENLRTIQK